jgi:glycosyltransferase involved in cell wall biosynthesis
MNVALCFGTFPPERNGGADFMARFASALAETGVAVHVVTSPAAAAEVERLADGVVVHRVVREWTLRRGRRSIGAVNEVLAREAIDVLHVFFPDSVLQGAYQLSPVLGLGRVPLVTTWWNLGLGRRSPWPVRLTSLALLARSASVSAHDPVYCAALRRLTLGRRPVGWLPVGSNFDGVVRAGRQAGPPTLGFFGQLDFTRGVDTLFEALARLDRPDVRLRMLGSAGRPERYGDDPEFRRLRGLPERLGIAAQVEWTGFLPDDDVPAALAALDLGVLPYRRNSLGRSALAAVLAAGVPVVLGGRPDGIAPLSADDVALVPPDDAGALADTIARLLDDERERERLGAAALRASVHFAWPEIARRALALYEEALR